MALDEAISMEPVKDKLKNLREYMPEQTEAMYSFGAYLADNLNSELFPQGFGMAVELALSNLQQGVDGSGQPICGSLTGQPPIVYGLLRMSVPQIAEAVCPEDFAKKVNDFYEEVNAKMHE